MKITANPVFGSVNGVARRQPGFQGKPHPELIQLDKPVSPMPAIGWAQNLVTPGSSRLPGMDFAHLMPAVSPIHKVTYVSDFANDISNSEMVTRSELLAGRLLQLGQDKEEPASVSRDALVYQGRPVRLQSWADNRQPFSSQLLQFRSISSDIPLGNLAYSAMSLLQVARNTRPGDILVWVTDPGVGKGLDRVLIRVPAKNGNRQSGDRYLIGPNNGTFSLLDRFLRDQGYRPEMYSLDLKKIQELKRQVLGLDNGYTISNTFHGRDIFGAAAGLLAGGVDFRELIKEIKPGEYEMQTLADLDFAGTIHSRLPEAVGDKVMAMAYRDNTLGNLKLNIMMPFQSFQALVGSEPVVKDETDSAHLAVNPEATVRWYRITNPENHKSLVMPATLSFDHVFPGEPLLYWGSTEGIRPNQNFLEVALNLAHAGDYFGITASDEAVSLEIERVDKPAFALNTPRARHLAKQRQQKIRKVLADSRKQVSEHILARHESVYKV